MSVYFAPSPQAGGAKYTPLTSDTGAEITEGGLRHGLHTLVFTVWNRSPHDLARDILELHGGSFSDAWDWQDCFEVMDFGTRWYKHQARGPYGVKIEWEHRNVRYQNIATVELTGEFMDGVDVLLLLGLLMEYKYSHSLSVARMDIYVDNCDFTPSQLYESAKKGDVNTRVKRTSEDWVRFEVNYKFSTCYIGSRTSKSFMRCYDKRGFTRLEIELKNDKALAFASEWIQNPEKLEGLIMGAIRSHVDFVDAGSSKNITRAALLPWWAEFVGTVSKLRLAIEKTEKTMDEFVEEVARNVCSRVAAVRDVFIYSGGSFRDWLQMVLDTGQTNRSAHVKRQLSIFGIPSSFA